MKLKATSLGLVMFALTAGWGSPSTAQLVGLPVLDTAGTRDPGKFELTPGCTWGEDMNFLGARASLTVLDEMRCFLDLGRLSTRDKGDNLALQAGGLYSMDLTELCETAVRAAGYYVNTDYLDIAGANLMFLFSGETLLDNLYGYGGAGLDYAERKIHRNQSEVNPIVALGLTYKISQNLSIFAEADYIDNPFVALGLSIR